MTPLTPDYCNPNCDYSKAVSKGLTTIRAALANAERVEHVPHVRGAMIWSKPK